MWRFEVQDISEQEYRRLRLLINLKLAEAHLVVKCQRSWPVEICRSPRQIDARVARKTIN